MPEEGAPPGAVQLPPRSGVPVSMLNKFVACEVLQALTEAPVPAFTVQVAPTTAGGAGTIGSLLHPEPLHDPVWLSLKVSKLTERLVPFTHAGPLNTLIVQQNCQFTEPLQLSPKLFPGLPSTGLSKKKPGPCGPMLVKNEEPCTELWKPHCPVVALQVAGDAPGTKVLRSHPGPKLASMPWNQFTLVWFQPVTVKQKVTVWPHA